MDDDPPIRSEDDLVVIDERVERANRKEWPSADAAALVTFDVPRLTEALRVAWAEQRPSVDPGEHERLREFADWLISLDEPDSPDRRTVTLNKIIDRARAARAPESEEDA